MRLRALFISVSAAVCLSGIAVAQTPPVVTIDSSKNFCVNGSPVFLIGTMGGDASAWQNYLKPAGFNFRFLGTTTTPGAHSVGLWEVPDVFAAPSVVATMKNDPGYLMWDVDYETDVALQNATGWVGHLPSDIAAKRQLCLGADGAPPRPVGTCWGNHGNAGSELWGIDGYWHSSRHLAQLGDYFVSGEYNVGGEQTISHAVRMTNAPVIAIIRCWPAPEASNYYRESVTEFRNDLWIPIVCGAKGLIVDRYEMLSSNGNWYNWVYHWRDHWDVISKATKEIQQIAPVLAVPGGWTYYGAVPNGEQEVRIIYTFRKLDSDVYLIACNLWPPDPQSVEVTVPVLEASAVGEDVFDFLTYGGINVQPTATTITDTSKNWTANAFVGQKLWIRHGSPAHDHYYPIASNTNNTITISSGNLLTDGVARGNTYKVIRLVPLSNRKFTLTLDPGGRKVIKFPNVTFAYPYAKTPAAVGTASNRRWKLLMDYSDQVGLSPCPADGFGLCYDSSRRRIVAFGGLMNPYPRGDKPNPADPNVLTNRKVWEWDLDSGYYSGPISEGMQQGGDPWPSEDFYYGDVVYDPVRQCATAYLKGGTAVQWRGVEQGWQNVTSAVPNRYEGPITHYTACYDALNQRFLLYGGKDWTVLGSEYRNWQFLYEWVNVLWAFNGKGWVNLNNPGVNLPPSALEEPVMCWDSARNRAVLFGLCHDGRASTDTNPYRYFQDTPQQTFEITEGTHCGRKYTAHVPYVCANYQMVFDPRTNTTLLFGGWPSVNGRGTDLYQYDGTDWTRLVYDHSALPAQDAQRIPTLVYDPDHQMVLFVDTRGHKVWGLTSGAETQVASIGAAKALPDGTLIAIDGKVVSRRFDGYFYMQEPDRTDGIRVSSPSTAVAPGKIANVLGTIATLPTGEKYIVAQVVGVGAQDEVRPLAMCADDLGGVAASGRPGVFQGIGANNVGLLVRVFGRVTAAGSGYVYIDDGSGLSDGSGNTGVKVLLNGVTAPSLNQYVGVTGVSGVESIAGHSARVVLVAHPSDIAGF